MIDNFDLIKNLLREVHPKLTSDNYFFGQIIYRGKDNNETGSRIIKDLYFKNMTSFDKQKSEIISLCNQYKARAYINLNVKSFERTWSFINKRMMDMYDNEDFSAVLSVLSSAAGNVATRDSTFNKIWIIDVDKDDSYPEVAVKQYLYENNINYIIIPTKNGLHLLTHPFRLDVCPFSDKIQKHNPTLLYYGD